MNLNLDRQGDEGDTPSWLEKLQQESWQAEILISGGAFIGLLSLLNGLTEFSTFIMYSTKLNPMSIGLVGIIRYLLLFLVQGFLLHLILRGYWIGLIGMNSVFPKGINNENLAFRGRFSSFIKVNSNTPYLIKLDQLSSLIFVLTFFVIFSVIGFVVFSSIGVAFGIMYGDDKGNTVMHYLVNAALAIYFFIGFIGFIDFLSFGRLRRFAWFSNVYHPFHSFVSFITLSFLYRRLYYTIASNIKPWYVIVFFSINLFITFHIITFSKQTFAADILPIHSGHITTFLSLNEYVVRDNKLQITIKHMPRLETELLDEFKKTNGESAIIRPSEKLKMISSLYEIYIDSVLIKSPDWIVLSQGHALFSILTLASLVDVNAFPEGSHQVRVRIRSKDSIYINNFGQGPNDPSILNYYARAYFLIDR